MNNKKIRILFPIFIIILIIISIIIVKVLNKDDEFKNKSNYKLVKVEKQEDTYKYVNNWKINSSEVKGTLKIEYNEKTHKITHNCNLDAVRDSEVFDSVVPQTYGEIDGDLILNEEKTAILTYENEMIPYINSKNGNFGIISAKAGINYEFDNGSKVIDCTTIEVHPGMQVYLDDNTTEKQKQELESKLKKLPNVVSIEFVSKEDALETMKEKFKDSDVLKSFETYNTLPESYTVSFYNKEDLENSKNEIEKLDYIHKITSNEVTYERDDSKTLFDIYYKNFVIKRDDGKYQFASSFCDINSKNKSFVLEYSKETYSNIYVVRNSQRELQGFIVTNENNKKQFLNKKKDAVTEEYKFINFIELNSKCYLICSNSNIKCEEDFKNAEFEAFNVDGTSNNLNKDEYKNLLKFKQENYKDENSIEYVLFK